MFCCIGVLVLLVTNLSVYCFDKTTIDRLERDDDDDRSSRTLFNLREETQINNRGIERTSGLE